MAWQSARLITNPPIQSYTLLYFLYRTDNGSSDLSNVENGSNSAFEGWVEVKPHTVDRTRKLPQQSFTPNETPEYLLEADRPNCLVKPTIYRTIKPHNVSVIVENPEIQPSGEWSHWLVGALDHFHFQQQTEPTETGMRTDKYDGILYIFYETDLPPLARECYIFDDDTRALTEASAAEICSRRPQPFQV
jgi:hypothetical protein